MLAAIIAQPVLARQPEHHIVTRAMIQRQATGTAKRKQSDLCSHDEARSGDLCLGDGWPRWRDRITAVVGPRRMRDRGPSLRHGSIIIDDSYWNQYGASVTVRRKNGPLGMANGRTAAAVASTRRQRRMRSHRATLARWSQDELSVVRKGPASGLPHDPDRLFARLIYRGHEALARKIGARTIEVVTYL